MKRPLSDADLQFLAVAARDVQQRLRGLVQVLAFRVDEADDGSVAIAVEARGGGKRVEFRGQGRDLVDAYRDLLDASHWDNRRADEGDPAAGGAQPAAEAHEGRPRDARTRRYPPIEPAIRTA